MADIWACVCCSGPGLLKDLRIDRSSLFKTYMELSAANKKLMTVFNCDSSSISHNVCLSVRNEFHIRVILLLVYLSYF